MSRTKQAEVIARLLSNVHPPSLTAMRRAQQIINSLEFHGYVIAPKEPGKEFLQAGYVAWLQADKTQVFGEAIFDRAYRAALASITAGCASGDKS
jgi:hypothetical protein